MVSETKPNKNSMLVYMLTSMNTSDYISLIGIGVTMLIAIFGSMFMFMMRISNRIDSLALNVASLNTKVDVLWRHFWANAHSPIALNERGREILNNSNFKNRLDASYDDVLRQVRASRPRSAYEVQEMLIVLLSAYQHNEDYRYGLHEDAFNSGSTIEGVLFVAALSIRDRVMTDLGFETSRGGLVPDLHRR